MSFWNKIIGKKKNTKSIVVYERENKKLWDYVRLLTELLEEKDKEIKGLNTEIAKIEGVNKKTLSKKTSTASSGIKSENPVVKKTKTTSKTKSVSKSVASNKKTTKKVSANKSNVKSLVKKSTGKKELSKEDLIMNFMKNKKTFFDYKAISNGTNIPESVVRTMISRMKKKGVSLEEKKDGKRKLIRLKK